MQAKTVTRVAGQSRALRMSTNASTVCFAVWTIFAIIGFRIRQELALNDTPFSLMIGTPILAGWLARIFFDDMAAAGFGLSVTRIPHRT